MPPAANLPSVNLRTWVWSIHKGPAIVGPLKGHLACPFDAERGLGMPHWGGIVDCRRLGRPAGPRCIGGWGCEVVCETNQEIVCFGGLPKRKSTTSISLLTKPPLASLPFENFRFGTSRWMRAGRCVFGHSRNAVFRKTMR